MQWMQGIGAQCSRRSLDENPSVMNFLASRVTITYLENFRDVFEGYEPHIRTKTNLVDCKG
jgi:hypothetical protein